MALDLTEIRDDFLSGGSGLTPRGSSGSPNVTGILQEHKAALETLESDLADALPDGGMTLLASTATGEGAALVGIEDDGEHFSGGTVEEALAELGVLPRLAYHDIVVLFSDLGSGASGAIAVADFPTNVIYLGAAAQAGPQFTGEADLEFALGFTGGATDALIEATALHETGVTPIAIVQGTTPGGTFFADASGDGLAVLFTATELDDVSAGSLTIRVLYVDPFA